MARGKHGSSSSGSSSCEYCDYPLQLIGHNWKDSKTDALFALQCIFAVALLVCVGLATQFKWTKQNGIRDTVRTVVYLVATISMIIYIIFSLVDTGLSEAETETTYLYYLTYIFRSLFWRISDLLIIGVVLKTVGESSSLTFAKILQVVRIIALSLVSIITVASFGIYVALIAYQIKDGPYSDTDTLSKRYAEITIAYYSLYLVAVLFAAVIGLIVAIKERTMATFLLLLAVIPAMVLRILLDLADQSLYYSISYTDNDSYYFYYSKNYKNYINLSWADGFVYTLAGIAIFIGLAIIGILRPKITAYSTQHQKVEQGNAGYGNAQYPNTGYANAGYANPAYGNTHVPVYN